MSVVSAPSLRESGRSRRVPDPCTVVIFGATGDLTHRKLMPALYRLARLGRISPACAVVGVARRAKTDDAFRTEMADAVLGPSPSQADRSAWETFAQGLSYVQAEFGDAQAYERLRDALDRLDQDRGTGGNRVYYLATAPEFYAEIVQHLGSRGLVANASPAVDGGRRWTRLIVEKPFGRDLRSARELNQTLQRVFRENQIYRIDHYLGKETVQNILVFRFANGIFEPIWNQHFIDHVQITVAETVGVEARAGYYETAGVVRDIVQNHMMQLLTLVAMEAPVAFEADEVREEKVKVLRAARRFSSEDVARNVVVGQYGRGTVGPEQVSGYLQEPRVAEDSRTPTFVAMRVLIDSWRWAGVPFFLRSGKRLPKRVTEIAVQFKRPPLRMFREGGREPNLLALRIQPDEGISLRFVAKAPGTTTTLRPVDMGFAYAEAFGVGEELSEYERLLLDCMAGDPTLFTRRDEVEEAWELLAPVLTWWEEAAAPSVPQPYAAGTWGPDAARVLIERDARRWRTP
ncbi:MAG TPA: glucose-6-phosphate dehydrogenase [bacterium]|nr:glucose-6-phosphate dehydrogenase [bacterium]